MVISTTQEEKSIKIGTDFSSHTRRNDSVDEAFCYLHILPNNKLGDHLG